MPHSEGQEFLTWFENNSNKQRNSELIQFRESGARQKIEEGQHSEIQIKNNVIFNTKSNWKQSFPFPIYPVFENNTSILLSSGSQVDTIRVFRGVSYQWWVVRKSDGVIISSIEFSGHNCPTVLAVFSNRFYMYNPNTKELWNLTLQ
jgi:hypothetical protein